MSPTPDAVLRTPDDRFAGLPDWPWASRYAEVGRPPLRMAYLDEAPTGAAAARTVLLLHGEPTWSYLYRSMVPPLLAAGLRVVAPDLIGFGRSDKPADQVTYTYAAHMAWLSELVVDRLDLRDAVLFGQDWGGLLGLRLVAEQPDRFAAVVASNTGLPTGDVPMGEAFEAWRAFSQSTPELPIGALVNAGSARALSDAEVAAYDAPFPDETFKAGARRFPALVPDAPDDPAAPANRAAWAALGRWEKPFVCAFSDGDPITRGGDEALIAHVPGAAGQPHTTMAGAAHFVQEDAGPALAELIARVAATA